MQVRKSVWISLLVSNGQTVIYFFASLVMARLLTPSDVGAFSIAVVVANTFAILRDLGCNPYLVRRENLTPDDVRGVLGLTLLTAVLLSAVLWVGRHPLADYYRDPRIADVMQVLCLNFLLVPPSAVLAAVLARRLDAVSGAKVGLASTLVHLTVSIWLAYNGYGPMAPALATTASLVVTLLLNRLLVERSYSLRPSTHGWRDVLHFSRGVLMSNLINAGTTALPDLYIGRRLGPTEVGLFSRATGVTGLLQTAIGPALGFNTLPVLAQAHRDGEAPFRYVLLRAGAMLTGLSWPFYIWLAVFAHPIIELLYGRQWTETATLLPWLCLAAAAKAPFTMFSAALQAANKPMSGAWAAFPTLLLRVLLLAALPSSTVVWIVAALSLADILALYTWVRVAHRELKVHPMDLLRSHRISAVVAAGSLAVALAFLALTQWLVLPLWVLVPLSLLVTVAAAACIVFQFDHPFAQELKRAFQHVRGLLGRAPTV